MERQAEQPLFVLLVLVIDLGLDIEERGEFGGHRVVGDDQNLSVLGDDEHAVGAVARVCHMHGAAGLELGKCPHKLHGGERRLIDVGGTQWSNKR